MMGGVWLPRSLPCHSEPRGFGAVRNLMLSALEIPRFARNDISGGTRNDISGERPRAS